MSSLVQTWRQLVAGSAPALVLLASLAASACGTGTTGTVADAIDTASADTATTSTTAGTATTRTDTADTGTAATDTDTAATDTDTADTDTTDTDTTSTDTASTGTEDGRLRQLTFNEDEDWSHGFSPDGTRIAFTSDRDGDYEIYLMNTDGTGTIQLTDNDHQEWTASWSPDGTRIAFTSDRDGDYEIYLTNTDGTGTIQLTNNDSLDWAPQWSPDGTRIAFSNDRDGDAELFIMNADGSNPQQLTDNDHDEWTASWSPDGARIAFDSDRDGDYEIYVMNADGTGIVQLTHNDVLDWAPLWSPDGARIVFDSDPDAIDGEYDGPLDVMVMNADGSGTRRLTPRTAYDSGGSWSPDGTRIAFTSDRDGDPEIFIVDAEAASRPPTPADGSDASGQAGAGGAAGASEARSTGDYLGHWPAEGPGSCGSWYRYLAPGDAVWLGAEGFAPNSVVEFVAEGASLQPPEGKLVDAPKPPATEADFEGTVQVMWTIPAAPGADEDSAPRIYAFQATGVNDGGGTHTASMLWPVVAYPATVPCAHDDKASTPFGNPVEIAVLDNDIEATANTDTHLEESLEQARGGDFSADTATGVVTFQPDSGFTGTASALYWTYDSWGLRRRGLVEVEVRIDCTIDGSTAAGAVIVGTDGDDVICVPDRRDDDTYDFYSPGRSFNYVVDARGGDDIVLGGDGFDLIYGGEGADTIYGRGASDALVGGPGADTIYGGERGDEIYSLDSEDTVIDVEGDEVIDAAWADIYWPGPFTRNDWAAAAVSETIIIDVLANDYDINGDIDPATLFVRALPFGTATEVWSSDGGFVISYTAPDHIPEEPPYEAPWLPAQTGLDNFQYEICDAPGTCSKGEVFIRIG